MSTPRTKWVAFAIASGACAALNGVFAKLTTTTLTTTWADALSHLFGLSEPNKFLDFLVRGFFFALNLVFNAIMWTLFTRALTLATSTVRVSIINTSANFVLTALLGLIVFSESLPPLWWVGAGMLVAGSVIIGRREEGGKGSGVGTAGTAGAEGGVLLGSGEVVGDEEVDAPIAGGRRERELVEEEEEVEVEPYRDEVEIEGAKTGGVLGEGNVWEDERR